MTLWNPSLFDSEEREFFRGETAISSFGALPDPCARNASHRLGDIIVMMVAASLCGATTATEFALFAENRKAALSRLIDYDSASSHDTFSRVLRLPVRLKISVVHRVI
ncbi:transposase family protein [Mesorhizobium sp. 1B3]|uniref:transposase family protein n=1 Tax=Mesorhizobium sp. 1B3 TaxID=3243599 RepID=UPI003D95766B